MTDAFLLRSDVVVEPLIARWHASSHLISPATSALCVKYRNLSTMRSYVKDPDLHKAACADPDLLGGPFLDLNGGKIAEISELITWTEKHQSSALVLAEAITETWKILEEHDSDRSFTDVYDILPPALKGMVELVYTPNGSVDLRMIEPLLYRSEAYDVSLQGALIHKTAESDRSFVMSTPRLDTSESYYLDRPFTDPAFELLGRMRMFPQSMEVVRETLNLTKKDSDDFVKFLTPARTSIAPSAPKTRWRYFGHACILIETAGGQSILIDPVIAYEGQQEKTPRYSMADLPSKIDYVLITHNHPDHVLVETLLAIRWRVRTVLVPASGGSLVDPSLRLAIQALGFSEVRSLEWLDAIVDGDFIIRSLPFLGEHADLDIRAKTAWSVTVEGSQLLFAADSNNLSPDLYKKLSYELGPVQTLFLGMECRGAPMSWFYGPMLAKTVSREMDQSRRLDGSNAMRALALIRALDVAEVKIYALGMEPWLKFISSLAHQHDSPAIVESNKLILECRALGIAAERLFGRAECFLSEEEVINF